LPLQKPGHLKDQCWVGGDKEGQGMNQQKAKNKNESANIIKNNDADELLHFHAPPILILLQLN
jgi:hypothetical protein